MMRIMKKLISGILIFALFSTGGIRNISAADSGQTKELVMNFNGITDIPDNTTASSAEVLMIDNETFCGNRTQMGFLRLEGSDSEYSLLKFSLQDFKAEAANQYAEIGFDLYTDGLKKNGANITMRVNKQPFFISHTGGTYSGENSNGELIASSKKFDDKMWRRYTYIFRLTDENGVLINELSDVYEDGKSIKENISASLNIGSELKSLSLQLSKKEGTYWIGIDNLQIAQYTSDDGKSPFSDKTQLKNTVNNTESELKNAMPYLNSEEYTEFDSILSTLTEAFYKSNASEEEIKLSVNRLNALKAEIENKKQGSSCVSAIYKNDFNSLTEIPKEITGTVDDTLKIDNATFAGDGFKKNILMLGGVDKGMGYPKIKLSFSDIEPLLPNYYTEINFDLYSDNIRKAASSVTIQLNENAVKLYLSANGGMYIGENQSGTKLAETSALKDGEWTSYRLIMQLSGNEYSETNRIVRVLENGIDVTADGANAVFNENFSALKGISFQISPKTVDYKYGIGIDNLSVEAYMSKNGISQISRREKLAAAAYLAEEYLKNTEYNYTDKEKESICIKLKEAEALYYKDNVSETEINVTVSQIKNMLTERGIVVSGITVEKNDGMQCGYITGGTLKKITLERYKELPQSIFVIPAVYSENGILENADVISAYTSDMYKDGNIAEIDASLALDNDIRSKKLRIYVLDDNMKPLNEPYDSDNTKNAEYIIKINETEPIIEVNSYIDNDGMFYVPAKRIINLLGAPCEIKDGVYTAESDDGGVLRFSAEYAETNGNTYPVKLKEGIIMVPSEAMTKSFGIEFDIDEIQCESKVVSEKLVRRFNAPPDGLAEFKSGVYSIHYRINAPSDAKIELWYKGSGGITWIRAQEPLYENNAWNGGIASLSKGSYDFRIRITQNGTSSIYEKYSAAVCTGRNGLSLAEAVGTTNGELKLNSSYENISYAIDKGAANNCEITYREENGEWARAYMPASDQYQFRGSITGLKNGSLYEVRAVLSDGDGNVVSDKSGVIKTLDEEPEIARTIRLSEIYNSGGLLLSGYHGSADGWIKIINDSDTAIDAESGYQEALLIEDCSYLIVDGFTVTGGYRYGINVADNSSNIRISNCNIYGWGRPGVLNKSRGRYIYDGADVNYDAGIAMIDANYITVERCYIHNSKANTNSWSNSLWNDVHPQGACGIYYSSKNGTVIRYNDIIGSYNSLFNDGIEGYQNGSRYGGAANNCDIYGNMIYLGEDDGIEADGGQMNARIYNNRIERFYCGISLAPNLTGPSYVFKNQIVNLGTTYNDSAYTGLKIGGTTDEIFGMNYLFHNTIHSRAYGAVNSRYNNITEYHSVSANNIFVTDKTGDTAYAFRNIYADERDNNDYDLIGGKYYLGTDDNGIPENGFNKAKHSINGYPKYKRKNNGNYHLSEDSPGKSSGVYLDNFNDTAKPDMGVYGAGDNDSFMPLRPVDIKADKYHMDLSDNSPQTITIKIGAVTDAKNFKILTDNKWLTTNMSNGSIIPDTSVTFTVRADKSKISMNSELGNEKYGMILFRLDNGYSIPISITLN